MKNIVQNYNNNNNNEYISDDTNNLKYINSEKQENQINSIRDYNKNSYNYNENNNE